MICFVNFPYLVRLVDFITLPVLQSYFYEYLMMVYHCRRYWPFYWIRRHIRQFFSK